MRRLLITIAASLALAGTAAAATTAPPVSPADGPDLSSMVLAPTDFALRGRLAFVANAVFLHRTTTAAQRDGALIRNVLSTRAGRKAVAASFARSLRPLRVKRVVVSQPTSIATGDFAFRFTVAAVTNRGRVSAGFAVVRTYRSLAYVTVVARRNASVFAADLVRAARLLAGHSRAGFTVASAAPPVITGTPAQGQTLTADHGRWLGGPEAFTFQWKRCDAAGANCVDIAGATNPTYVVTPDDAGFTLGVRVEAQNPLSTLTVESALTGVVT